MPTAERREREEMTANMPEFPRNYAIDASLVEARDLINDAVRHAHAPTVRRCKDHRITSGTLAEILDGVAKMSAHVTACESSGSMRPHQPNREPLSYTTLPYVIAEYFELYPPHEILSRDYLANHAPVLREGVAHFKLRHLMGWLRRTGRSDIVQSALKAMLHTVGYDKELYNFHVSGHKATVQAWYWRKSTYIAAERAVRVLKAYEGIEAGPSDLLLAECEEKFSRAAADRLR